MRALEESVRLKRNRKENTLAARAEDTRRGTAIQNLMEDIKVCLMG